MIAEFDAMVGMYIETVKDAGVWNNTVWVVTSDHGDMQFEHQQFYKMVPREARHNAPPRFPVSRHFQAAPPATGCIRTIRTIPGFPHPKVPKYE